MKLEKGQKIPLKDATINGKNPFSGMILADFCTWWDSYGHCVSFLVTIVSDHTAGGYYMVKLAGGKVVKLKKKLLKPEYK